MYIIRKVEEQDISILADIEVKICIISFQEDAVTDIEFHRKKIMKSYVKNNDGMFVIIDGDNIYGWLWADKKENYITKEPYVNFISFYIDEKIRGNTLVNKLFNKGIEYGLRINAKKITGKVYADNLPMRAIYKNAGFKATHISMEMNL